MKLTEKEIQTLQSMNKHGVFADMLERRKVDIFMGGKVTKDTFDEANGRAKELDHLIELIRTAEARELPEANEWE